MIGLIARKETARKSLREVDFSDDDSVAGYVVNRYETRDQHRSERERQWYVNIAQYLGYQYHSYDSLSGKLVLPKAPSYRVRLVANRLMGIVRKVVAKALRQRPIWTAVPATGEIEDQMVSLVAGKALRYYWRHLDMNRLVVDAFYWLGTTGNAFLSVVWDPELGPEFALSEEDLETLPEVYRSPQWRRVIQGGLHLGEISVRVHGPFEVDPDPECLRLQDAGHLLETRVRSLEYLEDRYGEEAKDLEGDAGDETILTRYYERRIQNMAGPWGATGMGDERSDKVGALTHTLWVNPTKKHPKGYYCVVAGGKVLHKEDSLPNPFHRVPFVHMMEIPVPGRFWGACALEQCIPLQAEYNRGRSQLIESRNLMSKPKWAVPNGSGVSETALTSEPGEVIRYNHPLAPQMIQPVQIPESAPRTLEYALKDLEDISSIHEVTQARAPSGVRSGVAIAQLQEQDDQMLAPTFLLAEDALSKVGSWLLQLLAENVTEDRMLKIVGRDREVETFAFTGKSLFGPNAKKPGVNYFDVETQLGSQLPLSRQGRAQYVVDLVHNGILNPVDDRKKILDMLELGTDEGIIHDDALDRQNARRANVLMIQGQEVEVHSSDNPAVHLEELRRFQKQPDYRKVATEEIDMIFERRAQTLELALQALQAPPPTEEPPGGAPPVPPELSPPPPEAELPLSEEEARLMAEGEGEEIPPELLEAAGAQVAPQEFVPQGEF